MEAINQSQESLPTPPKGLAILAMLGPSMVWCAEYIGSGEVILATRTGAILGTSVLWAVVIGIFLKYWIGMSGGRYTVCTGEGMIDMFARIPGPAHWVVWIVLAVQFIAAIMSIGSLTVSAGAFIHSMIPIGPHWVAGWAVALFALMVVWSGIFDVLKIVMSIFVLIIILGVIYVAIHVLPGFQVLLENLRLPVPSVPAWALDLQGVSSNPWNEVLPLIGWGAGGFASQVFYSYWVLGANYGAGAGRGYGRPADLPMLKNMETVEARKIKGWCKVLYMDATLAFVIGITATCAFLIAGAGILGPSHMAPQGKEVAFTLSNIFAQNWGSIGALLFKLAGAAALTSTLIGILAGWPRMLADAFRICIPGFNQKFTWKVQFRLFLLFFLATNIAIVYWLGEMPVFMVRLSAVVDGILLTPLQAIWVAVGLFVVMPKLLSRQAYQILKPGRIFAIGLLAAFLVFGYFCVFHLPMFLS